MEHTDSGNETFTVSIDMDRLHADNGHLTVGSRSPAIEEGAAFLAGTHTSMTITIKEPTGGADPNSVITGPGVVTSATELGVSAGGTTTDTVKLGAPTTDIVTVTPTVADGR